MKLSVILPTLNEERAVGKVISDIRRYAPSDVEIIVVDCSTDRTREIARAMGADVIDQDPRGHGYALRKGIRHASGDIIITSDCDDTYPISEIPRLIRFIDKDGYDIISGNRMHRANKSMPWTNGFGNRLFAFLVRTLYGIPATDVTTGMFAMRRELANAIEWETNLALPAELIIKSNRAHYRWRQLDIEYTERIGNVTLNKMKSGKAYLRCIFGYRFRKPQHMKKLSAAGKL